jgi:TolA-binding protein
MDTTLLWPALALLAGALSATLACRARFRRMLAALRQRLEQSEQARQTERERGQQMRAQIAQLTKLVTELQQRQRRALDSEHKRAELDKLVPDQRPAERAPLPSNGFADTLPM